MEGLRDATKGKLKSPPPVRVQQDFLFVDASKAKSSRQGRRNARSFVMQKARRERPWSTSKHASKQRKTAESTSPVPVRTPDLSNTSITPTPSPPIVTKRVEYFPLAESRHVTVKHETCSDCQIFACMPGYAFCHACVALRPPVFPEDVDNRLFDPFGTVSVEMNATVSELLDHYVTEMAPSTIPIDIRQKSSLMRSDWFGTALSNAGFMHSLLCTAALHLYFVGRGSMDTIVYHKTQAIAAINSAISDPNPNLGISDANIGAVFNLLCVEESLLWPGLPQETIEQKLNQREIHLNGLRRMVQLRGGLTAISSNRILQAFILWHSTAHAIASFEAPYLSTLDYISKVCLPRHPLGYQPYISNHLIEHCHEAQINDTLTELVELVLILIADLNDWFSDLNSPLDPLDIQNYSCVLECMLLYWLRDNENSAGPIADALCVASLIFTVRVTEALQHRSDGHLLHRVASKKLEKALSATSRCEWSRCQDLLLWILAIGAISAEGSPEYNWFVYQVSLACEEFGIHSADVLLSRLHLCGWVSYKLDSAVHVLWARILDLRLEPCTEVASSIGPLQSHVPEPTFTDWQNDDWVSLSNELQLPGEFGAPSMRGDEGLYNIGMGHTPSNNLFYMPFNGGMFNEPARFPGSSVSGN